MFSLSNFSIISASCSAMTDFMASVLTTISDGEHSHIKLPLPV
jgi:hypothetical protein